MLLPMTSTEARTERISVSLSRETLAKLEQYAARHRWAVSAAAAYIIEDHLAEQDQEAGR